MVKGLLYIDFISFQYDNEQYDNAYYKNESFDFYGLSSNTNLFRNELPLLGLPVELENDQPYVFELADQREI